MDEKDIEWYKKGLEENVIYISEADYNFMLETLKNPPEPNERLKKIVQEFMKEQVDAPPEFEKAINENIEDIISK